MTQSALTFFVLAIFTVLAGAYAITGASIDVIKILSLLFLLLGILSYIASIINQNRSNFQKH
jgi:hypothetical protein